METLNVILEKARLSNPFASGSPKNSTSLSVPIQKTLNSVEEYFEKIAPTCENPEALIQARKFWAFWKDQGAFKNLGYPNCGCGERYFMFAWDKGNFNGGQYLDVEIDPSGRCEWFWTDRKNRTILYELRALNSFNSFLGIIWANINNG